MVDAGPVDHGHQPGPTGVACDVGVACEEACSSAVTFCWRELGLQLESLSSTRTCVRWLAVADCRPGPLTWHVQEEN